MDTGNADFVQTLSRLHALTTNIGYPKLFTGGEESGAEISPQPPVNNFAGERRPLKSKCFMTDINQNIEY